MRVGLDIRPFNLLYLTTKIPLNKYSKAKFLKSLVLLNYKYSYILQVDGRNYGHSYGRFDGHTYIRTDCSCIIIKDFVTKCFFFYNIRYPKSILPNPNIDEVAE